MPAIPVRRALIHPLTLVVLNITNIAPSNTQWLFDGVQCWVAPIGPTQTPVIGDIYTPLISPITIGNTLNGGTFAAPPPSYPPIEESRSNGIAAVNLISNELVTAAVGIADSSGAVLASAQYADLTAKIALNTITPTEQATYDELATKNAAANDVIVARDALIGWLNAQTDPATLAAFEASNPPPGFEWP